MASINAGNLSKGMYVMYKDQPNQVVRADFMAPGKGSPIMRTKLKSVTTGAASETTYKTNEQVEVAEVDKKEMQFLYRAGDELVFMDPKNYEQATIPITLVEDQVGYLIADMKCWVMWFDERAIGISLPPHVNLRVVEAPDSVAGNRVNAPKKLVKLETGIEVQTPLFIKEGDAITLDTTTGEYLARVVH